MAVDDVVIANRFREALEAAVQTGDLEGVYPLLAPDVEWVIPQRALRGIDEVKDQLTWIKPSETFDFEFGEGEWVDQGDGNLVCTVHHVYRMKDTGDVAYERDRQVHLRVRDGLVRRYEMRFAG